MLVCLGLWPNARLLMQTLVNAGERGPQFSRDCPQLPALGRSTHSPGLFLLVEGGHPANPRFPQL
jgi:hypothetical protein